MSNSLFRLLIKKDKIEITNETEEQDNTQSGLTDPEPVATYDTRFQRPRKK